MLEGGFGEFTRPLPPPPPGRAALASPERAMCSSSCSRTIIISAGSQYRYENSYSIHHRNVLSVVILFSIFALSFGSQCATTRELTNVTWTLSENFAVDELLFCPRSQASSWSTNVRSCLSEPLAQHTWASIFDETHSVVVAKQFKRASSITVRAHH